jgi:hypothetical protein
MDYFKPHKITRMFGEAIRQGVEVDKIDKINVKFSSESFAKGGYQQMILDYYTITPLYDEEQDELYWKYGFEINLQGFPDWVLPYIRLFPVYGGQEGVAGDSLKIFKNYDFMYYYHNGILKGHIYILFDYGQDKHMPEHKIDLYLQLFNPLTSHAIQTKSE